MKTRLIVLCVLGLTGFSCALGRENEVPHWLTDYTKLYAQDPRAAAKAWFKEAKFGLFVHLNLASLCENGKADYLLWKEGKASDRLLNYVGYTRVEYEKTHNKDMLLFHKYELKHFDAEKICTLAVKAEMKYITFTSIHLGRCYNFRTRQSEFNSLNAACGRDLAQDLAEACRKHGLGLFFYVPPEYVQTRDEAQIRHNRAVLTELLTQYGPIAGIWFDGIGDFYKNPEYYTRTKETFALIRRLQPHALISFKEGGLCDEDFITPEHFMLPFAWDFDTPQRQARYATRKERWERQNAARWKECNQHLLREVNTVMQECYNRDGIHVPSGWINDDSARHLTAEEVYDWLKYSRHTGSNLLMNIGPRADGSIHPDDWQALPQVGHLIRTRGWPQVKHEVPLPRSDSGTAETASGPYQPTWESLAQAPIPRWWDEGKFGIFIHWGPYSVAGYKHRNRGYAEAITADLYRKPDDFNNKGKTPNWPVGVGCIEADNLHLETIGPRWQNPATLGTSYAYMAAEERGDLYKTPTELVRLLCDVVSKNGNLLLNIGPRADGTIPEGMQRRLRALGAWLKLNGEAIYGSRPWKVSGEYSGNLLEEDDVTYTKHGMRIHTHELRYTSKPDTIYALVMRPLADPVLLKSFADFGRAIESISLLGSGHKVNWTLSNNGLHLAPPRGATFNHVAVYKITAGE